MSEKERIPVLASDEADAFRARIYERGKALYRDLPWRNTRDPYEILVSEIMLQQTQVARVLTKWSQWLDIFPSVDALAASPMAAVLEQWQGLGYNRRAIALKRCAEQVSEQYGGKLPCAEKELVAFPGIGPATASGVRAFAFGEPGVYLETNVRTVFLHEFFPETEGVSDKELIPLVAATCDRDDPRAWYYALLDYGAQLKKELPNPSRRSKHHTKQSKFEGSRRQKRAWLVRAVLAGPGMLTAAELAVDLSRAEQAAGRDAVETELVSSILEDLAREGFLVQRMPSDPASGELPVWSAS